MRSLATTALAATLSLAAIAPAAAATVFTDAGAFGAASTNVMVNTFDTPIPGRGPFAANDPIVFDDGTSSATTVRGQFNQVDPNGTFLGGTRRGRDMSFDQTVTFTFADEVTAFAADFANIGGIEISGMFDGMLERIALDTAIGSPSGFFGLTSTTAFQSVTFRSLTGGFLPFGNPTVSLQANNFRVDNLALGDAALAVAPVPLPASALLLVGAIGGFGALRRSRKAA